MSGFQATKPVSIWNKEIKTDFKEFFKGLTQVAAHGVSLKWDELPSDAADIAAALGVEKKPAEVAWLLIRRALERAIVDLVREYFQSRGIKAPDTVNLIVDELDLSLEKTELTLTARFFDRPDELPIIDLIQNPFIQWLQACRVPTGEAQSIAHRLKSYFVLALFEEWRSRPDDYQIVREALLNTPFHELESQAVAWSRYNAVLVRQINEPVFDAAFGLRQIYVSLRGWYWKTREEKSAKPEEIPFGKEKRVRIVVELEETLLQWALADDRKDAIRIVSGGPGSGKSTFTKLFAWKLSAEYGRRVLFIPLHRFRVSDDLPGAVSDYAKRAARLPRDPLDTDKGETRILLIFDGLDELGYACALTTKTLRCIRWPELTSLGSLMRRLQGQRLGGESVLAMNCLGYLNAQRQVFDLGDYYEANFSYSDLSEGKFIYTVLMQANLAGANLAGAYLSGANLKNTRGIPPKLSVPTDGSPRSPRRYRLGG